MKHLSETDICMNYITPAIAKAGWDTKKQVRREVTFTDGRINVRGNSYTRGKRKRADYILYHITGHPIAIIEAKDAKHSVGSGMQQGLEYSEMLDIPFVFSSNGKGFLFHDKSATDGMTEKELALDEFPSPEALWNRYRLYKGIESPEAEKIVNQEFHKDESGKEPRYYQSIAVNRTVEAVAKGQQRILLVMATGTGKTYTAFQIAWRLHKAGAVKRILFLADRNILTDQTKSGDFKPFGQDIMTKITGRKIDKAYQVYFGIYQGLTSPEEAKKAFKEFSSDFFDCIIIDECHRGSASEASAWREILRYFDSATHIGLTATPKETEDVSNIAYFGEPLYTYSLKQGIDDGFLAPYKVIRLALNIDDGYRPETGKTDKYGHQVKDRVYNTKDYDKSLVIDERTQTVANKITEFLQQTDPFAKTIVFCIDTEHAERMRQALINANVELVKKHPNYVVRITGNDEVGKHEIERFTDVEERFPVIATTSKLLTTGVDTKMVKLIVLEANIGSMTEFKQIVGRGTRIREQDNKVFFTIMDFRKATNLFADPDFDGDPVQIYTTDENGPVLPPDNVIIDGEGGPEGTETDVPTGVDTGSGGLPPFGPGKGDDEPRKYYIKDVPVSIVNERVQYLDGQGQLITESLTDYSRKNIKECYADLNTFINRWTSEEKKEAIIKELLEEGVFLDELKKEVGKDMDTFDLIAHVAFDQPALTRQERANNVRKRNYFGKYSEKAQSVIKALLEKYENEGILSIEDMEVLKVQPFNTMGSLPQLVKSFGGKNQYLEALKELETELYKSA
ncbi:EcoAI/FtnUII family type I restriction enzme subunit R [Roseivirga spongicola]|uniref:Restriction endonuclease n=1 Tax=Roseivirga spongicola TaxID=333140 RepID=A0A150X1R5_9BACT|nr:DEAD/DEAH box helicase family protein [Roseivirga spongicola]KYG72680.1 restriction endonuclease [Roseivirga spongicola]WPZ10256.1 DEAD/DEAH box helicase family protein [Roseivirga spongicola]